ncbi:MAG: biotin synthase BioB [Gammaproteobacteria bacterium]|nr:biotin synthase BioB [Gammaproteobacteria bacterium]
MHSTTDHPGARAFAKADAARELGAQHDWTLTEARALYEAPITDLVFAAQALHRHYFDPNRLQLSTLLNVKTGGCPEDCAYCPQSAHHDTGVTATSLLPLPQVIEAASRARDAGATRFCMGAAWRAPRDRDVERVAELVAGVAALGMETCVTLGMLTGSQAASLKQAGLDYYNHNLDTSAAHYDAIISTRSYEDRLQTLRNVRDAGLKVCCGGIIGMGESLADRLGLLVELAGFPVHPESVPINLLVPVAGTPLASVPPLEPLHLVRTIAVARLLMPQSYVRLSAGRSRLSRAEQALCFLAGANSLFYGERLLTTANPALDEDQALFADLGLAAERANG